MGWHFRNPQSFPAMFFQQLQNGRAALNEPQPLFASSIRADVEAIAEQYRWWKWCVRQRSGSWAYNVLENFDVRTRISEDAVGFMLWLTVKPTKVSEFITLNPELAVEIIPECQ